MKTLLIVLALLFVFTGCVATIPPTYNTPQETAKDIEPQIESAIDPYEVSNIWTHIGTAPMAGYPLLFFINPDVTAKIQYVAMMFNYDLILAYTYIDNNEVFLFIYRYPSRWYCHTF